MHLLGAAGELLRVLFLDREGHITFQPHYVPREEALQSGRETIASWVWQRLNDDPLTELARLLWQEQEAQRAADEIGHEQIELRRIPRRGELSQRDYEVEERNSYMRLDDFQSDIRRSAERYVQLLAEVVAAMPRPSRDSYRCRVLALVDRLLYDSKQRQQCHPDQWDELTLTWRL